MTQIQSEQQTINHPLAEVFSYLSNANNHQALMPESIYNWSSTEDECKFTIQNMAKLELYMAERSPAGKVIILPKGEAPFDIRIEWEIKSLNDATCTVTTSVFAELNPFIKMMAVPPLTKLVNHQVKRLAEILP
jgi:hypothetical protein